MKLKGLHVTLPVCDWRYFLDPDSRQRFLSTLVVERGRDLIKGFGFAGERKNLRIPWRAPDTIFFDCFRAISLPDRLPDGARVTHVVRRVYLDGRALVRFELAIFTNPEHRFPQSHGRLDELARAFWESEVRITQRGTKSKETIATALPKLVSRFAEMTSERGHAPLDLCRELDPQLHVTAEASPEELDREAKPVDSEGKILLSFRSLRVLGKPTPVDTAYLAHLPGYFTRPHGPEFNRLRVIRTRIAWMHADLEILTHILKRCILEEIDPLVASHYLAHLAEGVWDAPGLDHPEHRIVFELMRILEEFHDNRISRLLTGLEASKLSMEVKDRVVALLKRHVSRDEGGVSAEPRPLQRERAELLRKQSEVLLVKFDDLTRAEDAQRRGYLLKDLLNRTFGLHGIPLVKPFTRNEGGEQIDGAFKLEGWHYLVECRWRERVADIRQLDGLKGQVDRSGKQTMGLFLSVNGWSENVCPLLKQNPDKSIILMDGYDLRNVLCGRVDLRDFILAKVARLNLEAEPFLGTSQYLNEQQNGG